MEDLPDLVGLIGLLLQANSQILFLLVYLLEYLGEIGELCGLFAHLIE